MNKELYEQLHLQLSGAAMVELARSPLFQPSPRSLSLEEATRVTYQRAKAFTKAYGKSLLLSCLHIEITDDSRLDPRGCFIHYSKFLEATPRAYGSVRCWRFYLA